jgi:hypothetical protein
VAPGGLQQAQRADDVRLHEGLGGVDRPVDVAFGGEVDDAVHRMLGKEPRDERRVANVPVDEEVPGITRDPLEVRGVAGVRELVQVDHAGDGGAPFREQVPDEVAPDEPAASGDKDIHCA